MLKRLILGSLCLVIAVLLMDRKQSRLSQTAPKAQISIETSAQVNADAKQTKQRSEPASQDRSEIRLSAENLAELNHCGLPSRSGIVTMDDVIHDLAQTAGKVESRTLIWRNIHFRAKDGENRRLRLWTDFSGSARGRLKAQLYTLDEEGLPVPVSHLDDELSDPTPSKVAQYLVGKSIRETQEKLNLSFNNPTHLSLSVETRNSRVRSFEVKDNLIAFQCVTAPEANATDCKCLHNPSSD